MGGGRWCFLWLRHVWSEGSHGILSIWMWLGDLQAHIGQQLCRSGIWGCRQHLSVSDGQHWSLENWKGLCPLQPYAQLVPVKMSIVQNPLQHACVKILKPVDVTSGTLVLGFLHLILLRHAYIWYGLQLLYEAWPSAVLEVSCVLWCVQNKLIRGLANIILCHSLPFWIMWSLAELLGKKWQ